MNFDSNIFKIFYLICGIGTVMCFSSSFSAFTATIRYLNSVKIKLSVKTAALHRNFLHSLILTVGFGFCEENKAKSENFRSQCI